MAFDINPTRACPVCATPFPVRCEAPKQIYCSGPCQRSVWLAKIPVETRNCERCGTPFQTKPSQGGKPRRFCSTECKLLSMRERIREKMIAVRVAPPAGKRTVRCVVCGEMGHQAKTCKARRPARVIREILRGG